jgi:hypothetical protein
VDELSDQHEFDEDIRGIAQRLEAQRPLPHPAFRGRLRRDLMGMPRRREPTLRAALALSGAGSTLLAVAFLGVIGLGPLSP